MLADCGVALASVPPLPRTRAHGATYWLTPVKAVVQLSARGRWADEFWFSLMHELGHLVLRHAKKEVFIAWDTADDVPDEELAAEAHAQRTLVPQRELEQFVASCAGRFAADAVERFAAEIGVCPGVVVARLQGDGVLKRGNLNGLRREAGARKAGDQGRQA